MALAGGVVHATPDEKHNSNKDQNVTDHGDPFVPGEEATEELKKNSNADADVCFGFIFREHSDVTGV